MTLKGEWSGDVTYSEGDVARYPNGHFYQLVRPCKAGTPCADALYWNYLPSPLQECAKMIMDMGAAVAEEVSAQIPKNIDDDSISLKTETSEYVITVDDSGDTPELVVTEDTSEEESEGT